MKCTMVKCFQVLAEFWTYLLTCKDDSLLMVLLDKSVQQLFTNIQVSSHETLYTFHAANIVTYRKSAHRAFIDAYINSPVDIWRDHGSHIRAYILSHIQDALITYIPPSMHALRLKAITPNSTIFDAHVASTVAYDLHNSGVHMLSTYKNDAHLHSVALVFIELLYSYTSIHDDMILLSTSITQSKDTGQPDNVHACMTKIYQRFTTMHSKFLQMWTSQFRLGIAVCNQQSANVNQTCISNQGISNQGSSKHVAALREKYTSMLEKVDVLSDVQFLDEAIPTSIDYPYMSSFTQIATCLQCMMASIPTSDEH